MLEPLSSARKCRLSLNSRPAWRPPAEHSCAILLSMSKDQKGLRAGAKHATGMSRQDWSGADLDGANEPTRTADLLITSELLYQLSYIGGGWRITSAGKD